MHLCWSCGCRFNVNRKQEKFFGLGTPELCSLRCVRSYVEGIRPVCEITDAWRYVTRLEPWEAGGGEVWSHRLDRFFRSEFEVQLAELLVILWGWELRYEYHSIRVARRKRYVPDFYIPASGVWIEVKGMWHSGDKRKFKQAADMIGEDRFVLVGPYYQQELRGGLREIEHDEWREQTGASGAGAVR